MDKNLILLTGAGEYQPDLKAVLTARGDGGTEKQHRPGKNDRTAVQKLGMKLVPDIRRVVGKKLQKYSRRRRPDVQVEHIVDVGFLQIQQQLIEETSGGIVEQIVDVSRLPVEEILGIVPVIPPEAVSERAVEQSVVLARPSNYGRKCLSFEIVSGGAHSTTHCRREDGCVRGTDTGTGRRWDPAGAHATTHCQRQCGCTHSRRHRNRLMNWSS